MGRHLTEEHKRKISEAQKGRRNLPIGYSHSEETRRKISESQKGKTNKGVLLWKGKKRPPEIGEKISKSLRGKKRGEMPAAWRERIRAAHKGKHKGENSNFWKGGLWENKEYQRARMAVHKAKRRALEANARGKFTEEEWLERKRQYGNACPACGTPEPEVVLTVDHIIPLSRGGTNWIWNIQPLCKSCNSRKNKNMPRQLHLIPA